MRKPDEICKAYLCEIEVDVEFDYQPEEEQTRTYPGCAAEITVCSVMWNDIELLGAIEKDTSHIRPERNLPSWLETIEDQVWEHIERSNPEDDGKGDYLHDLRKEEGL